MTKHLIDKSRGPGTARLRQYLKFERAQNPDRASLMLQRRLRKGPHGPRLREYLRIERGQEV